MANRAAFLESAKGAFVVRDADIEQPGEKEILIKVCNSTVSRLKQHLNHSAEYQG